MTETIDTPLETAASGFAFTEDPRWRNGKLYFVDMHGHKVHALGPDDRVETVVALDGLPSGLGFMPNGDLLIVSMSERKLLQFNGTSLREHADLSSLAPFEINDMAVDRHGRAYVSQMGSDLFHDAPPQESPLLLVEPDGTTGIASEPLMVANGIVITPDGSRMFAAESMGHRISTWEVDDAGRLSNRRIFAQLPETPDGICLDTEGGIWVCCVDRVLRVEDGGRVTHTVPIPEGRYAAACMLGGADRQTLYICTFVDFHPDAARELKASRIERVRTGFTGTGLP